MTTGVCGVVQVNAALAAKLMAEGQEAEEGAGKKDRQPATELLADERFKSLFEDKAFAIDEQSEEYKALHPNAGVWLPPVQHFACQAFVAISFRPFHMSSHCINLLILWPHGLRMKCNVSQATMVLQRPINGRSSC